MRNIKQWICFALIFVTLTGFNSGCATPAGYGNAPPFSSYLDVPGITGDEIHSIRSLQAEIENFVYAMPDSTEAFVGSDGSIGGYSTHLCGWLSELFGIPFIPVNRELSEIFAGLDSGDIDFTGELTSSPERRETYFMTDAIAERTIKQYRLADSEPISEISRKRAVRCCFIEGAITVYPVTAELEPGSYETVFAETMQDVYGMLNGGEADVFFYSSPAEAFFDRYNDVRAADFYPLILLSVSMCAKNPKYEAIISVIQKAMDNGGNRYMAGLYSDGYHDYLKHKLYLKLDDEEKEYIRNSSGVRLAAAYDDYPTAFYNEHEKQWQGVAIDIIDEISLLTSLNFELVSDSRSGWSDIIEMLEDGSVSMVAELPDDEYLKGRFLWPDNYIMSDYFALLSKSEFPFIDIGDVLYLKVGLMRGTSSAAAFDKWFSDRSDIYMFDNYDEAAKALDKGEIDVLMSSRKQMQFFTNYREESGYKINYFFGGYPVEAKFGFNKNEPVLCSIVDKSLALIDRDEISERWMRKGFDYRLKMTQSQIPWLIGAGSLLLVVIVLMTVLLQINKNRERKLEQIVKSRTIELETQSSVMRAVFDSSPDLLFCMDMDLKYMRINKSMEEHFNIREENVIGKGDREVLVTVPENSMSFIEEMNRKVIYEKTELTFEEMVPGHDGDETFFETTKVPLWRNGEVIGLSGIAHNITSRKIMEQDLKDASESKSAFLANMSHELRTPLNVIIGLTDLLLEESLPEKVSEDILSVSNAGGSLLSIVNDILDISKIESGKLELTPVDYHMPSLLNDTIVMTNTYIGDKPLEFKLLIDENIPNMLNGDELRVKQIMNNLLSNAVKYTLEGTIELQVDSRIEDGEVWLEIYVRDTGIGVKEEYLDDLFAEYQRVDTLANRKTEGTGLGLPISLRLAMLMGGNVTVKSEYGVGSEFCARLKQGYVSDVVIGREVADNLMNFNYSQVKRQMSNRLVRPDMSYASVLVVDDMQNNLDVAAGLMSRYHLNIDCVTSGFEAIEKIKDHEKEYSAVFMDHMMQEMDGIETAIEIRKLGTEYALKLPIIALTANAVSGAQQLFFDNGFQDFLSKPIDIMQLDSVLRRWVRDTNAERKFEDNKGVKEIDAAEPLDIVIPGVDSEHGLFLYGGDSGIFLSILRSFASGTMEVIEKLRAVTEENFDAAVTLAHGLKGTSGNISAERLREESAELEMIARNGDYARFIEKAGSVIDHATELVGAINSYFTKHDKINAQPEKETPDRQTLKKLRESCGAYDMSGIDEAIDELSAYNYKTGNELVSWLKKKVNLMELGEAIERLNREIDG